MNGYNVSSSISSATASGSQELLPEQQAQQLEEEQQFHTSFCRALYDYEAQDPSALSFRRDDIIEILTRQPSGWWDGLLGEERGWFPSNYVVIISDEEAEAAFAQAEFEAQAASAAGSQRVSIDLSQALSRGAQSEQEERLNNELALREGRQNTREALSQNGSTPSDFWMPEVTADGQIYYVNQQTGQRSRDLPQETEDDVSDVDLVGLPSASTSGMSAFGYSEASSESENDVGPKITERWVKRLANDGVSYFYLNTLDGRVQWTAPEFNSFHSSHSKTASQPDTSCLSVYSDDSDVQPFDHVPKSRSRQNTDASHRIQGTRRSESAQGTVMELTSAERIARSLQQVLEPPPPDVVGDLTTVTRDAIRAVVENIHTIGNGFQPEDERNLDQLVYNVILAIRNLLYIAGAPSATSAFSDASRDAKGLSSRQSSLKPSQRKVTATLSRLVLSARAIQYDSGSTLADTLTRIETDSEELERAVTSFVSDAQRFERHEHFKEFPKRLHGIFTTSNIGLGLLGGGAAGSWKGFGYLATNTESDMPSKVLGTEIISEIGLALSRLYDSFDGLTRVLRTTTPDSIHQVRMYVKEIVSQNSAFLSLVADIHIARHVDIDGIRQGSDTINDQYSQSVENARRLVRTLETAIQAVYDDSAAILFTAQGLRESIQDARRGEQEAQYDLLDSLSTSLRKNLDVVKQNFEALLSVGHEQADIAQGDYNGSIDWRMSRISAINEHLSVSRNPAKSSAVYGSDNEDVVDIELAFNRPGFRKPKTSTDASFDSYRTLGNSEPMPLPSLNSEISVNETLVASSPGHGDGYIDDGIQSILEDIPAKPTRATSGSNKLQRLLGDEYVDKVAADLQPWYLRPDYSPSDILIEPDGSVRGGTLPALVERLTAHEQADTTFNKAFLMTYKSLTSLDELFKLLVERFRIQPPENLDAEEREEWGKLKQRVIQMRVLNTFKSMITDEGVMEKEDFYILDPMKEFISSDEVSKFVAAKQLLALIERARGQGDVKTMVTTQTSPPPAPITPKTNKKLTLLDIDPLELARQLTIVESSLYQKIKPIECLTRSREQRSENLDNISNSIQTSNRIADWVADNILSKDEPRKRTQVIKHLIMIADRCRNLNNFSTMAAIISGLNTPPIRRLKRTWEHVSLRFMSQFEACNAIIDSKMNFTKYKQVLATAAPPCVPFIGPYLTNLEFIQVGNRDKLPSGLINFRKRQKASEVINDVKRWQSQFYNLQSIPVIQTYISESLGQFKDSKASGDRFWALSNEREPREREDEKMTRLLQESGFL